MGWQSGPRGARDALLRWIAPLEYVVNETDTARNLPLLQHINSGGDPEDMVPMVRRPRSRRRHPEDEEIAAPAEAGVTVHIHRLEVHGDVADAKRLARTLAPPLRDELKRQEPRFSRVGAKTEN